jgi:hypothetical protein
VPYAQQIELIPRTKDERIAELEAALRLLLDNLDEFFGYEGERGDVEKKCWAVLENRLST